MSSYYNPALDKLLAKQRRERKARAERHAAVDAAVAKARADALAPRAAELMASLPSGGSAGPKLAPITSKSLPALEERLQKAEREQAAAPASAGGVAMDPELARMAAQMGVTGEDLRKFGPKALRGEEPHKVLAAVRIGTEDVVYHEGDDAEVLAAQLRAAAQRRDALTGPEFERMVRSAALTMDDVRKYGGTAAAGRRA